MNTLNALKQQTSTITVECRITYWHRRRASNGTWYTPVTLQDVSGQLYGYAWDGDYEGPATLAPLERVLATISAIQLDQGLRAKLKRVVPVGSLATNSVCSLPVSACPVPEQLEMLSKLVSGLTHAPLIAFVNEVFADDRIALPFISIPASITNHHNTPGGLLVHSIETATLVRRFLEDEEVILTETAIVAALLHDVGKVRTLLPEGRYAVAATLLDHDVFTHEILAPHFDILDRYDHDLGLALRALLLPAGRKDDWHRPMMPVIHAVRAADRYSAARDAQRMTFENQPEWKRSARLEGPGPINRFWRPRSRYMATLGHQPE